MGVIVMARKKDSTRTNIPDFVVVKDSEGVTGTMPDPKTEVELPSEVTVHLDKGGEVTVPSQLLSRKMLGSGYVFKGTFAEFYGLGTQAAGEPDRARSRQGVRPAAAVVERPPETVTSDEGALVVPVVKEQLKVGRKRIETGKVRISKVINERRELIEEPVFGEDVEVKRVPIDRVIDGPPPPVRMEGDVMIIPLLEERVVTRKQVFLKEELHVIKRKYETTSSEEVTLRTEEAVVEEVGPEEKEPVAKAARRRGAGR
jgi:uncharacterized protein (TIGR02271 family)